jgi:hypothetical protein
MHAGKVMHAGSLYLKSDKDGNKTKKQTHEDCVYAADHSRMCAGLQYDHFK